MTSAYPNTRLRRLRSSGWIRDLTTENRLNVKDLIWPVFVMEGEKLSEEISSLPGVKRHTIDNLCEEVKKAEDLGIPAIALFPTVVNDKKSEGAEEAFTPDNLICRTIRAIKNTTPNIGIITDVALDPYTSHGHDGILKDGEILNDETIDVLVKQSLNQAEAGADILAPSDMMDGRVGKIRKALEENDFKNTMLLSYAAKYASNFYGPFRDAVNSKGALEGDKKTYQMNLANADEAMREVALDIQEGADMVMIKPGLNYLDIIADVKQAFNLPTYAYHVSGEYAMLKAAAQNGWLDYEKCLMETLTAFKRAGCNGILTYGAIDAALLLKKS